MRMLRQRISHADDSCNRPRRWGRGELFVATGMPRFKRQCCALGARLSSINGLHVSHDRPEKDEGEFP